MDDLFVSMIPLFFLLRVMYMRGDTNFAHIYEWLEDHSRVWLMMDHIVYNEKSPQILNALFKEKEILAYYFKYLSEWKTFKKFPIQH